jgi:hypothetical protein
MASSKRKNMRPGLHATLHHRKPPATAKVSDELDAGGVGALTSLAGGRAAAHQPFSAFGSSVASSTKSLGGREAGDGSRLPPRVADEATVQAARTAAREERKVCATTAVAVTCPSLVDVAVQCRQRQLHPDAVCKRGG